MKVVLFSLMIIFSCRHAVSQNWQLLGEDETGDCADISIPDFSLAFYAVDTQQDSLWLLFVYDTSTSDTHGDFGLVLGVDTNLVLDDGDYVWDGPTNRYTRMYTILSSAIACFRPRLRITQATP